MASLGFLESLEKRCCKDLSLNIGIIMGRVI